MQLTGKRALFIAFAIATVTISNAQVDDPNDPEHLLSNFIVDNYGSYQTTNQGVRVNDTDSLKVCWLVHKMFHFNVSIVAVVADIKII